MWIWLKDLTSMVSLWGFVCTPVSGKVRSNVLSRDVFVWQFVLDLVVMMRMTDDEKDLEIMLLRQ